MDMLIAPGKSLPTREWPAAFVWIGAQAVLALAGCGASTPPVGTDASVGDGGQCDADGDGYEARACGGSDCDDHDPDRSPSIAEVEGGSWLIETVAEAGLWPDLAVSSGDTVTIVFVGPGDEPAGDRLLLGTRASGSWSIADVAEASFGGPRVATDSRGSAHLLWGTNEGLVGTLHHARDSDIEGAAGGFDSWDVSGGLSSLAIAIDAHDVMHAVFVNGRDLVHATPSGDALNAEVVLTTDALILTATSASADRDGGLHAAAIESPWLVDECPADPVPVATYATNASGAWEAESVDAELASDTSIALAGDTPLVLLSGDPSEFSRCAGSRGLRLGRRSDAGWDFDTHEDGAQVASAAVAVDAAGSAHVAFASDAVRFQENADATWSPEVVEGVGANLVRIAIRGGNVHVAYSLAFGSGGIRYGRRSLQDGIDNDCDGEAW